MSDSERLLRAKLLILLIAYLAKSLQLKSKQKPALKNINRANNIRETLNTLIIIRK